jgi:hypothetical protein
MYPILRIIYYQWYLKKTEKVCGFAGIVMEPEDKPCKTRWLQITILGGICRELEKQDFLLPLLLNNGMRQKSIFTGGVLIAALHG